MTIVTQILKAILTEELSVPIDQTSSLQHQNLGISSFHRPTSMWMFLNTIEKNVLIFLSYTHHEQTLSRSWNTAHPGGRISFFYQGK